MKERRKNSNWQGSFIVVTVLMCALIIGLWQKSESIFAKEKSGNKEVESVIKRDFLKDKDQNTELVPLIPPILTIEEGEKDLTRATYSADQYITSSNLTKTGKNVQDGDTLYINDVLFLDMNWTLPNGMFHENDILTFSIPKEFKIRGYLQIKPEVYAPDGQLLGMMRIEGNDTEGYIIYLTLNDYVDRHVNVKGSFHLESNLNKVYVQDGTVVLPLPGSSDLTVTVTPESGGENAYNPNANEKTVSVTENEGIKYLGYTIGLGKNTILKGKTIDEIESILIEDTLINARFIPRPNNHWGTAYMFTVPGGILGAADYDRTQLGVQPGDKKFIHDATSFIKEHLAKPNAAAYVLYYAATPDDPATTQTIRNEAKIRIKYSGESTETSWTLVNQVEWTTGGGQGGGENKGNVELFKKDNLDGHGLQGAEFTLYKAPNTVIKTGITTDAIGRFREEELELGDYYFIETKAPNGYILPNPPPRLDFIISAGNPGATVQLELPNQRIDRKVKLRKVEEGTNAPLGGSVFVLQQEVPMNSGNYTDVNAQTYTSQPNGEINLTENQIATFGNGRYRFREVTPPVDYELPDDVYTSSFVIADYEVSPDTITKTNRKLNHQLTLEKRGEEAPNLLAGAEFIIQGQSGDGRWHQIGSTTFTTNVLGRIIINNNTQPNFLKNMIAQYPSTYQAFRFRETKAPAGGYKNPKYTGSPEAAGNPGNQFSVGIDASSLKDSKTSLDLSYSMFNEFTRYDVELQKVDALGRNLDGAEFSIWRKDRPNDKQLMTGVNGLFSFKDLIIGKTYVIKETRAPLEYGLQSYEYNITLNLDETLVIIRDDTEGGIVTLVAGRDYEWNGNSLKLHFKVVNKKIRRIPVTGGMGIYLYIMAGAVFLGIGYNIKLKRKKEVNE